MSLFVLQQALKSKDFSLPSNLSQPAMQASDWPVSGSVGGNVGGAYNIPTAQDSQTYSPVSNSTLGECS